VIRARFIDDEGVRWSDHPMRLLAAEVAQDEAAVRRAVDRLVARGLLERKPGARAGRRVPHLRPCESAIRRAREAAEPWSLRAL
jgi:DNA-binding MarR family transcriptional regulator